MGDYYNDHDSTSVAWLSELVKQGQLPPGAIDGRSIKEINATDVRGCRQVHFFAGIGGWSYALRLAGWPESVPVWTGSCPCQPYSTAGKQRGDADERNLWPEFFRLIRECRPEFVFGEQVASAIRHGWLDGISADLEGEGYTVGACVLGAHSVGAPHIRQRLYWVAHAKGKGRERMESECKSEICKRARTRSNSSTCRLADSKGKRESTITGGLREGIFQPNGCSTVGGLEFADSNGRPTGLASSSIERHGDSVGSDGSASGLGNSDSPGLGEQRRTVSVSPELSPAELRSDLSHWDRFDLIPCRDGKARRIEPGSFPLAHGIPGRVGLLRGYGNAIVPQVAAAFVRAFMESTTWFYWDDLEEVTGG